MFFKLICWIIVAICFILIIRGYIECFKDYKAKKNTKISSSNKEGDEDDESTIL